MTRPILFRGKRLDNGEWVEGSLIQWGGGGMSIVAQLDAHSGIQHTVDPQTVSQYSGINDSKGRYIFEGDIIHVTQVRPIIDGSKDLGCLVATFDPWVGWHIGTRYDRYAFNPNNPIDVIEVVGNIWDNKDLIKAE